MSFALENVTECVYLYHSLLNLDIAIYQADQLYIADPQALKYVFETASHRFPKSPQEDLVTRLLLGGSSMLAATGTKHARHRKAMNPAFSTQRLRTFLTIFQEESAHVSITRSIYISFS
jgi:cytochrome P450